jgi:hypothetical protein
LWDTDEQDLGDVFDDGSFGLGEGAQLLAGEAVHEQGDEVDDPRPGQPVDGLIDVAFDGLQRVDAAELLVEGLDGAGEGLAADRVHGLVAERHGPASLGHDAAGGNRWWGVGAGDLAAAGGPARGGAGDQACL